MIKKDGTIETEHMPARNIDEAVKDLLLWLTAAENANFPLDYFETTSIAVWNLLEE